MLKQTTTNSKPAKDSSPSKNQKFSWQLESLKGKDWLTAFMVGLAVFLVNFTWYCFDHHVPMMDEAGHIINSLGYRELFNHPNPFRGSWWHDFLTVNTFYPPTVYMETGFLKTLFGSGRIIDVIVHCGYSFILASSIFLTTRLLGFGVIAGVIAGALANMYPETASLSHMFMLDFPAVASTGLGIFLLCYWWQKQTVRTAILAGLLIGFCCLTKQIVTAFLLGTGLFFTVLTLLNRGEKPRKHLILQLSALVLSTLAIGLPWILTNFHEMNSINEYAKTNLDSKGLSMTKAESFWYYINSYWYNMSPLLCTLFAASIAALGFNRNKKLAPVWASALIGFGLMCCYVYPLDRYIMPSLVAAAIFSGIILEQCFTSKIKALKLLAGGTVCLTVLQFTSFNFAPYPISFKPLADLSGSLGVKLHTSTFAKDGTKDNPTAYKDWGYDWAFKTIESRDKGLPVYLNLLVNEPDLNAQTFDLETKERSSPIRSTTSLIWSIVGDELKFSEETALYYHWYMVKTGKKERRFKNEQSRKDYNALIKFILESGRYKFIDSMEAPDGDTLSLYRQKK